MSDNVNKCQASEWLIDASSLDTDHWGPCPKEARAGHPYCWLHAYLEAYMEHDDPEDTPSGQLSLDELEGWEA